MEQVSDADGMKHYWLGSALFRPPVIMIRSKQITVRFVANGGRASGYRATYKFINGVNRHEMLTSDMLKHSDFSLVP